MTYSDKATELEEIIKHDINHSNEISLDIVNEWNKLINIIMSGNKTWNDIYI